ncbi:MAG: DUF2267 domain-containing protein [Chitinivibrionales bacterium]|nr:DUF2267 domain-containing protein [Chitinivibrionales bacterium]
MKYDDFIKMVQARAEIGTKEQASQCVQSFLQTLGERLYRTERDKLAAQLPDQLKPHLYGHDGTDEFLLEEFYNRMGARCGLRYGEAVHRARAIASVLREAVSEGEIGDVLSQLPTNFDELFGRPPRGPLSPSSVD